MHIHSERIFYTLKFTLICLCKEDVISLCMHLSGCVCACVCEMCVQVSFCSTTLHARRLGVVELMHTPESVTTSSSLLLSAVNINGLSIKTVNVIYDFFIGEKGDA